MSNEKHPVVVQLEQMLADYFKDAQGPSVSGSKVQAVVKHALKNANMFKFIVWAVERYLTRCPVDFRIFGIYTVDKIARTIKKEQESGEDQAGMKFRIQLLERIESKLGDLFGYLLRESNNSKLSDEDLQKVRRLVAMWDQMQLFKRESVQKLYEKFEHLQMASAAGGNGESDDLTSQQQEGPQESNINEISPQQKDQQSYNPLAFDYGEDGSGFDDQQQSSLQVGTGSEMPSANANMSNGSLPFSQHNPQKTQELLNLSTSLLNSITKQLQSQSSGSQMLPQPNNVLPPQFQAVPFADPRRPNSNLNGGVVAANSQSLPIPDAQFLAKLASQIGVPLLPQQQISHQTTFSSQQSNQQPNMPQHLSSPPIYSAATIDSVQLPPVPLQPALQHLNNEKRKSLSMENQQQQQNYYQQHQLQQQQQIQQQPHDCMINDLPVKPAHEGRIKYAEPALPINCARVLSRSLYIGNIPAGYLSAQQMAPMLADFAPEHITINRDKFSAFTKLQTREDAERCKSEWAQKHPVLDGQPLRINWACGFGPKELFDRRNGVTEIAIHDLQENDVWRLAQELGSTFLRAYWTQITNSGQLYGGQSGVGISPKDLEIAEKMGGLWLGGLTMEEPDTTIKESKQDGIEVLVLDKSLNEPVAKRQKQ